MIYYPSLIPQTLFTGVIPDVCFAFGMTTRFKRSRKLIHVVFFGVAIFLLHFLFNASILTSMMFFRFIRVVFFVLFAYKCLDLTPQHSIILSLITLALANSQSCLDQAWRAYALSSPLLEIVDVQLPGYSLDLDMLICYILGLLFILVFTGILRRSGFFYFQDKRCVTVAVVVFIGQEILMFLNSYHFDVNESTNMSYYFNLATAFSMPIVILIVALISTFSAQMTAREKKINEENERLHQLHDNMVATKYSSRYLHDIAKNLGLMNMYVKENRIEEADDLAQKTLALIGGVQERSCVGNLYLDYILDAKHLLYPDIRFVVEGKAPKVIDAPVIDYGLLLLSMLDKRLKMIGEDSCGKEIKVNINVQGRMLLLSVESEINPLADCKLEDAIIENIVQKNKWTVCEEGNMTTVFVDF